MTDDRMGELQKKVEKYCGDYAPMTLGRHRIEAIRSITNLIRQEVLGALDLVEKAIIYGDGNKKAGLATISDLKSRYGEEAE